MLGPLLFLVSIGDIDKDITSTFVSSFADDTRVAKGISSVEDVETLQLDLQSIYEWAEENNMEFNFQIFETLTLLRRAAISRNDPRMLRGIGK